VLARPLARLGVIAALFALSALVFVPLAGAAGKSAPAEQLTPVIGNPIASPEPVLTSDGRRQLAYELQLINRTTSVATVKNLKALVGGKVVESLSGDYLLEEMAPYGQPEHSVSLQPGQGAYVLMDVSIPAKGKVPMEIDHRISVSLKPAQPAVATTYELAPTKVNPREAVVVAPPLRGPGWVVGNGCCAEFNAHRGTVLPVNGSTYVAERFAIDFVQLNLQNKLFNGPLAELSSYPYFGDQVYSATGGKVVSVTNDVPETTPVGSLPKGVTAATAGGNHVVVSMGNGRYAFYAHFQPGSVTVKVGQKVKVGQVLGLLGNSGNSDGPHLHFHVMDSASPLASNGVPYRFSSFSVEGRVTNIGPLQEGAVAQIERKYLGPKQAMLPMDNQVVAFPGAEPAH
jgi:biotin carboxyl carrier protein